MNSKISYINKNIGFFTLALTIITSIVLTIVKFELYIIECGKMDYLKIDRLYIDMSNENAIYELIIYVCVSVLGILFMLPPFYLGKSECQTRKKILGLIGIIMFYSLLLVILFIISVPNGIVLLSLTVKLAIYIFCLIISCVLSLLSFSFGNSFKMPKNSSINKSNQSEKTPLNTNVVKKRKFEAITFIAVITFSFLFFLTYVLYNSGKSSVNSTSINKFIDENHVVIFENKEIFIVSPFKEIGENAIEVDVSEQKIINKNDVTTIQRECILIE